MTHTKTVHPAPSHLIESYRQGALATERALLELRIDVLALIDAALIRSRSAAKGRAVTVPAAGNDAPEKPLYRSVMLADARKP
jgi:3-oxoacyl-ACP reductase-like protein